MNWYYIGVNPDPWAVGPLSIGKRGGKFFPKMGANAQLVAFKQAVKEDLESQDFVELQHHEQYVLRFYFWRRLEGTGRNVKHYADATNMQKATEDALQDVLIGNDRDVRDVQSIIVAQGPEVARPGIVVGVGPFDPLMIETYDMPDSIWLEASSIQPREVPQSDNTWPPS